MKQRIIRQIGVFVFLISIGFLTIRALSFNHAPDEQFSQRVNLALRQTADALLRIEGNHTSRIKPVIQIAANAWLIDIEQNFNYDTLPALLNQALLIQHIQQPYDVAVLDCYKKELMLGYSSVAYLSGADIPCTGRERVAGCYQLTINFLDQSLATQWRLGTGIFILTAFAVYQWYQAWKKKQFAPTYIPISINQESFVANQKTIDSQYVVFGQSRVEVSNQKLWVQNISKDLTYREQKLLLLFCKHQNQLLERDFILKAVWEDEGILVGRSLDVFVSRLRKLLKEDSTIKIVNVHSVGYRFEVER